MPLESKHMRKKQANMKRLRKRAAQRLQKKLMDRSRACPIVSDEWRDHSSRVCQSCGRLADTIMAQCSICRPWFHRDSLARYPGNLSETLNLLSQ